MLSKKKIDVEVIFVTIMSRNNPSEKTINIIYAHTQVLITIFYIIYIEFFLNRII